MTSWFQTLDDSLWLPPDEQGEEEAQFIRKALALRIGQAVLDAPCGAGRISYHLAVAGCKVAGVDMRPPFIARAMERFRAAGLDGMFIPQDLRELSFDGEFDAVFNWHGSFGYFSEAENADLVARYCRALHTGGKLLIEQRNREWILRNFRSRKAYGTVELHTHWVAKTQRVATRWIVDGVSSAGNRSSMRLYTPRQMQALLERNGMQMEAVYGSREGDPFSRMSPRMIVVGRKLPR
ncbi:SAM-dependent methyltransferase [Candidatus Latescibacterota bacterium]